MSKLTPVTRGRYAGKRWRRSKNFGFASQVSTVPVATVELSQAAMVLPLGFIETAGFYSLVAILSLVPNRNMFVAPDGRWLCGHIPALLRCYPFRIIRQPGTEDDILCTDEDYKLAAEGDQDGVDFFDQNGNLAPALKTACDFLVQVEGSLRGTQAGVAALAAAGVMRPWKIQIKTEQGFDKTVDGLHAIDEAALAGLGDEAILNVHKAGGLPIAYAQLLSMGNLNIFKDLSKYQTSLAAPVPDTLDQLFKIRGDDEVIRFN